MTTAADDSAVEDAFEALLVGRPVPEGQAGLAAFTRAVRSSASQPGRPNAALAELLATGLLTDQSSPSVRTARSAGSPPARPSRVRIRRRTVMLLPALIAKFLSAGAVAQAATGASVVVIAFTGAGSVGALPAPAQNVFAAAVETVTPLEAPTAGEPTTEESAEEVAPEEALAGGTTEDVAEEVAAEGTEVVDEEPAIEAAVKEWADGPTGSQTFSEWVHEGNRDGRTKEWLRAHGMSFGTVVSAHASGKGFTDAQKAILGLDVVTPIPDSTVEVPVETVVEDTDDAAPAVVQESAPRGNSGNAGKARGQGDAAKGQGQNHGQGHGKSNGNGKN